MIMQNTGPVLSYTVTNDRGWNDPPSFAFSPNGGSRKRIDPRKRVSHNISGVTNGYTAPIQQPSFTQPAMNNMTQNFNSMSLNTPSQMHHASSNPDLLQHQQPAQPQGQGLYPLHHSTSVPNQMNNLAGRSRIPGHVPGTMTPPPSSNNTPPPFIQPRSGSATPPSTKDPNVYVTNQQNRKFSVPTIPISSSIFDQHSTPTMLQSSHLSNKLPHENGMSNISVNNAIVPTQLAQNLYNPPQQQQQQPLPQQQQPTISHLSSPVQSAPNCFSPVQNGMEQQICAPGVYGNVSPTTTSMAPPTSGYYARRVSNGHSPLSSGHSSPIPSLDPSLLENDQEVLKNILKKLDSCREQCSCHVTQKVNDDMKKKVKVFETAWNSGKLSAQVKGKMAQLSNALASRDFALADRLHKSLLHEHSNEVSSWLVGIKKLISCYQELGRQ